jgi:hypothetical protein
MASSPSDQSVTSHSSEGDEHLARTLAGFASMAYQNAVLITQLRSQAAADPRGIAWSFEIFAGVLAAEGRSTDAARLWGVSDKLVGSVGGALSPEIRWIRDRYLGTVNQSLGAEDFAGACDEGRGMPIEQAIALAHGGLTRAPLDRPSSR